MASVWEELKRRNVVKVAMAYAIVGWLVIEMASVLGPALNLPDWTTSFVAFLLILGFPVALVLSWAYELTPEGMKKAKSVPLSESITHITGRKLDFVIIGLLVLAVGFMFVDNYLPESEPFAGAEIDPASLAPEDFESSDSLPDDRDVLANSVAVLPFENLSLDPQNAFFAAGIHEEVLNQLVKLSNLSIISRTSVLRYEDSNLSIPQIAEELNVETVMQGSVRYADGRVRISAQLIDAATDEHLWSDVYERDFADIFGIQSDIAMNIANALEAEFSLTEQQSIERVPTRSPQAYQWYLRSLTRTGDWLADIDRALALDPDFALAHAFKARIHAGNVTFSVDADTTEEERLALEHAERALALDPKVGLAYVALANVHETYWRWVEARQAYEKAYELSPADAEVLAQYGRFMRNVGNYPEAIRVGVRGVELDPLNQSANNQLGVTYRFARDNEAAAETFRQIIALNPVQTNAYSSLGVVEATRGNHEAAVRNLRRAEELFGENISQLFRYAHLALGYALADRREDAERMFRALEERAQESSVGDSVWALAHIALGEYDQALARLEAAMAAPSSASYTSLIEIKANPWAIPQLDQPRFREVLDDLWAE